MLLLLVSKIIFGCIVRKGALCFPLLRWTGETLDMRLCAETFIQWKSWRTGLNETELKAVVSK